MRTFRNFCAKCVFAVKYYAASSVVEKRTWSISYRIFREKESVTILLQKIEYILT